MHLKSKLEAGEFVILAEMEPPKGADVSAMVANATRVKGEVDAFVVPEMNSAVMRMSALGGAMVLQAKGMETVVHFCCRDRNRLALQADLLAASACQIDNIMAVTGEDPSFGDHHEAKAVYDIDLPGLLNAIRTMQEGRDMAGIDLAGAPRFLVGSTVNPAVGEEALDQEIEALNQKIEAGCTFFVSPPLFDMSAIAPFLEKIDPSKICLIPTVLLLKSVGMARYIERNRKYIHIPKALIQRLQKAPDKVRECILVAREMVESLRKEGFSGALLSTMGWEHKLPEVLGGMGGEI
jgi:5,10-methylenetetrahydrofolate reductase